jgi:hypothetical protein
MAEGVKARIEEDHLRTIILRKEDQAVIAEAARTAGADLTAEVQDN